MRDPMITSDRCFAAAVPGRSANLALAATSRSVNIADCDEPSILLEDAT